jgi:zinc transport system substrate-binding protein
VDPPGEALYRENYDVFAATLAALDEELRATLAAVANRHFIVFHPSFGYFARDYDLIQIAVEQGGSEPDAAYLIRLVEQAKEHGIRIIFAAPQFSSRSAEVIAREIGGEVVTIDPLARDYIENMRHIADAFAQLT